MRHVLYVVEILAAVGSCSSIAYYLLCLYSARSFVRQERGPTTDFASPLPVSILKPLKGTDPRMYECFRTYCVQDYPEYEIIFGVSEADDPALMLVERIRAEF